MHLVKSVSDMEHKFLESADPDIYSFNGVLSHVGNEDREGDVIRKGAFDNWLNGADEKRLPLLWQHDIRQPIGWFDNIKLKGNSLVANGKILRKTSAGNDAAVLLEAGAIKGLSMGFKVKSWEFRTKKFGRDLNDVTPVEGSIVTIPANRMAQVIKSESTDDYAQRVLDFYLTAWERNGKS